MQHIMYAISAWQYVAWKGENDNIFEVTCVTLFYSNSLSLLPSQVTAMLNFEWSIFLLVSVALWYRYISPQYFMQFCLLAFDLSVSVRFHMHSFVTQCFHAMLCFEVNLCWCVSKFLPFPAHLQSVGTPQFIKLFYESYTFGLFPEFAPIIMPSVNSLVQVILCNFSKDCIPRNRIIGL